MFQPESLWGKVKHFARNRRHPAATMVRACSDFEVAQRATFDGRLQLPLASIFTATLAAPPPEEAVLDSAIAATPDGCKPLLKGARRGLTEAQQSQMHNMYMERSMGTPQQDGALRRLRQLWLEYLAVVADRPATQRPGTVVLGAGGSLQFRSVSAHVTYIVRFQQWALQRHQRQQQQQQPDPTAVAASAADLQLASRMKDRVTSYRAAMIGTLKLTVGSWFLARPSFLLPEEAPAMWFGHVEHIFEHDGPAGGPNLILQVS
jgi:hypothetical protein